MWALRVTPLRRKKRTLDPFSLDEHGAVFHGGRGEFPPPAHLETQVWWDPVASDIRSFVFHSIFTSCGTASQKQSSSTAGINKLKEDAHYQLQTLLLLEAFSVSLSLHQHQQSRSWKAIRTAQLEMINERNVTTAALSIWFSGLFFSLKDIFVYSYTFFAGGCLPPCERFIWMWQWGHVSFFLIKKKDVKCSLGIRLYTISILLTNILRWSKKEKGCYVNIERERGLVYLGVLLALGSTYYIFKSCNKFVLFNISLTYYHNS